MSEERWELLERIQKQLNSTSDIPPEMMPAIADRLEEAISASTRIPLQALSAQMIELFYKLLSVAPLEAANAVRGTAPANSAESAAYLLGQVNFAQLAATQAVERRTDDAFLPTIINDHRYARYVDALLRKDCTGKELAEITKECEETVSRKLKRLRELGITDFRREGTHFLNFLTPSARAVSSTPERLLRDHAPSPIAQRSNLLDGLYADMPVGYKSRPTFSISDASSCSMRH